MLLGLGVYRACTRVSGEYGTGGVATMNIPGPILGAPAPGADPTRMRVVMA